MFDGGLFSCWTSNVGYSLRILVKGVDGNVVWARCGASIDEVIPLT